MNFIGDALGVHCDYCHVTQGTDPKTGRDLWLYERDDKNEKIRGREIFFAIGVLTGTILTAGGGKGGSRTNKVEK